MSSTRTALDACTGGAFYKFGQFQLSPDGTLLRDSTPISLPPRELAVLRLLLANAGQVVPAEQLRESVWTSVHVSADSLPRCISSLRMRLGSEDCIQTLYKRGYRFQIPVQQSPVERWIERRVMRRAETPRVAILPFALSSGIPDSFGPGIAEETMIRLSRNVNRPFEVLARDSVFACAAEGMTALQTGQRLNADLVLTGTITAMPIYFRLRAEMVRVADHTQLWIDDFLLPRDQLAFADARMAKRIVARMRSTFANPGGTVDSASDKPMPARPTSASGSGNGIALAQQAGPIASQAAAVKDEEYNSEAYSLHLQARFQMNSLEPHQMQDAMNGFERAIQLDPSLMSARIQLLHGYLFQSSLGYLRPDTAAQKASEEAAVILSMAPRTASIYPALGWIRFHHERNLAAATEAFSRPDAGAYNPHATHYRARFAACRNQFGKAIDLLRTAAEVDSYSPWVHGRLAWTLHLSGDYGAALKQAQHAVSLFPRHPGVAILCANVMSACSDPGSEFGAAAADLARGLMQSAPYFDAGFATLAYCCARQGLSFEARSLLDRQQGLGRQRFVMRSFHAPALIELGEFDAAVEELAVAEKQHCPWFFELLADPRLQPLRGHPGFEHLRRIPQQLESASESVA